MPVLGAGCGLSRMMAVDVVSVTNSCAAQPVCVAAGTGIGRRLEAFALRRKPLARALGFAKLVNELAVVTLVWDAKVVSEGSLLPLRGLSSAARSVAAIKATDANVERSTVFGM